MRVTVLYFAVFRERLGRSDDVLELADGKRVPVLATSVPKTEDGSWVVQADGTMQTTWRLRAPSATYGPLS